MFRFVCSMGATLFVNPMDLVKNRMQMSGIGGAAKEYKNSFHALTTIFRKEGFRGIYAGYVFTSMIKSKDVCT
jgi:solute carrier family 25 (mitochondrial oxoglutarate transporter), member 11